MSKLTTWAERVIKEVDEDGSLTKRITMTTVDGGQVWDTWEAPFSVENFVTEAEALKNQLAEEFPKRRVSIMWTAIDAAANLRSQLPDHIMGRNAQAADITQGGPRALAESMDAQARTMDRILKSAETQCQSLTKTCEMQGQQIHDLIELYTAQMQANVLKQHEEANTEKEIATQIKAAAPMLMDLIGHFVTSAVKPDSALAKVAQVASSAMNGHANAADIARS